MKSELLRRLYLYQNGCSLNYYKITILGEKQGDNFKIINEVYFFELEPRAINIWEKKKNIYLFYGFPFVAFFTIDLKSFKIKNYLYKSFEIRLLPGIILLVSVSLIKAQQPSVKSF